MVVRVAGLAYQKGFGGHFHNDNSLAVLRDVPGLVVAVASDPRTAPGLLRSCLALARDEGRVCVFVEPIARYHSRDTLDVPYSVEGPGDDLLLVTFGNGVPFALRTARALEARTGRKTRVVDLRWLQPLNATAIAKHAGECERILVLDEGRRSAGIGEGVITAIVEGGHGAKPLVRVVGDDTYTPLAGAANLILPTDATVLDAALKLVG